MIWVIRGKLYKAPGQQKSTWASFGTVLAANIGRVLESPPVFGLDQNWVPKLVLIRSPNIGQVWFFMFVPVLTHNVAK